MHLFLEGCEVHKSWVKPLSIALSLMDQSFLDKLECNDDWLPGKALIFKAFSIPKNKVKHVLLGESPYPRKISCCGYCFFDATVDSLWSKNGLSVEVNRATSLRNFMKMLLVARGSLKTKDTSKEALAILDKAKFINTGHDLFIKKLVKDNGFLLLNYSLALEFDYGKNAQAKMWEPFTESILTSLALNKEIPNVLLFGKIAGVIKPLLQKNKVSYLEAEHPYNISFISNKKVQGYFKELDLLLA